MARQTSVEAYVALVDGGGLAKANRRVYEHLYNHGATTQKKTERALGDRTYTMRPRFAQLERMGLIYPCGTIICEETHKKNILWDVTDRVVPLKPPAHKSKKEIISLLTDMKLRVNDMFLRNDLETVITYLEAGHP